MSFTRKRLALSAGALATVGALLVGCAGGSAPGAQDIELETDPSKISGDIRFMTWWAYADDSIIEGFNELYPNVNVELDFTAIDSYPQKVQSLASSNDLPDVFASQQLPALTKANQLYDFNDALATDAYDMDGTWGDSFVPALLAGANTGLGDATADGQTFGVPFNAISVASIYNMDIFAEVGITPPTDFEGLLDNCRALDAAGYIPMSLTGSVWGGWWAMLAWDQTMRDSDVADFDVSSPEYIRGLQLVEEMAKANCWDASQITADIATETSLFLQKQTAQFISVPENFLASVVDGATFEVGTYVLPAVDGVEPNRILGGGNANVIVVSNKSENVSAAVAFAKYLTSEEVQRKLAAEQYTIPSINIDIESGNPLMAAYLTAAGEGFTDPTTYMPAWTTAGSTTWLNEVLPSLILGKITAEEAAAASAGLFEQ